MIRWLANWPAPGRRQGQGRPAAAAGSTAPAPTPFPGGPFTLNGTYSGATLALVGAAFATDNGSPSFAGWTYTFGNLSGYLRCNTSSPNGTGTNAAFVRHASDNSVIPWADYLAWLAAQ